MYNSCYVTTEKDFKEEEWTYVLLGIGFFSSSFARPLRWFSYLILGNASYGFVLNALIWLFPFFLYSIKYLFSKIVKSYIICIIGASILLLFSYLCFPMTEEYYYSEFNSLLFIIIRGIPCAIIAKNVDCYECLLWRWIYLIRFGVILELVAYITGIVKSFGPMEWGIAITPFSLIYFALLFSFLRDRDNKLNIVDYVLWVLSVYLTLMAGRQWLIIIFVCILSCYILETNININKLMISIISLALAIFIYIKFEIILSLLNTFTKNMGITSRALDNLINGTLLDTSNRTHVYLYAYEIIKCNGFKISGLFADRYFMQNRFSDISYVHNIFLELLIDFGILFGSIISFLIIVCLIKKYFKCTKRMRYIYLIFVSLCFLRYLVSSSFLIEDKFVILLGIMCNEKLYIQKSNVILEEET